MAESLIERLQQQDWIDPLAQPLNSGTRAAFERIAGGRELKNALHGTWLGHPLHPVLTDIPVGAWLTAITLDVADVWTGDNGYGRAADVAIGFGLAGAVGAATTGLTDWSETDGKARRLGLIHGLLNVTATALYATSLVVRRQGQRSAGRAFSLAATGVMLAAAYLGGSLVYRERIGVTHADDNAPDRFVPVLRADELPEGTVRRVDVEGNAVMIARKNGRLCALAQHCSHLGGPLSEGQLKDETVVCPWHGSEFRLDSGKVVNGPATHPQPCYQVREHAGAIEVGPPEQA